MKVRCNHCMEEFDEEEIVFDKKLDRELCPKCKKSGALTDLGE